MTPEPLTAFPRLVVAGALAGLRRTATRSGLAMGCAVSGWGLMWAQALDLAPLPAWPGLTLFGLGLGLIPTLRTSGAEPARRPSAAVRPAVQPAE